MSSINWNDWGAIATVVSSVALAVTACFIWRQLVQIERGIRSTSYHSTYNLMVEIDRFFFENTKMIKYFREGVELSATDDNETKKQVMMVAEMLADYFDNVFHQKKTLPSKKTYYGFEAYMQETYSNSPALKEYLKERKRWYPEAFIEMLTKNNTNK
jgi:uncharacterized membrane protein YozB (DUF420 family)